MNKGLLQVTSLLLPVALCLNGIQPVAAQSNPAVANCNEKGVLFGFVNGVNTTPDEAEDAKIELAKVYGPTSPKGDPITYELLYNHSNGLEDFVETVDQRLQEQGDLLAGGFEFSEGTTGTWDLSGPRLIR